MAQLQLQMNENLFVRDPQETVLGRKIVESGIRMIDTLGFEKFTFRKLAEEIDSTEASIYRYFENKHRMLVYLIAWYWNWMEYRIDFGTQNINNPVEKLKIALKLVAEQKSKDPFFPDIDEAALYRIVINESDKTYLTRQVDEDNKEGLFRGFKSLCKKIADIVKEINPNYTYPHALISTVLQAAHQQIFFAMHLPSLTELSQMKENRFDKNNEFLEILVFNAIGVTEASA
jgi:AcrR family transcriptional regulator